MTLGVQVELQSVESKQYLFSKLIRVSPRYILVNKTNTSLIIRQKGQVGLADAAQIKPDTRQPLYWPDASKEHMINIGLPFDEWDWSGDLKISDIGALNFVLRNKKDRNRMLFMRTDTRQDASNIYIMIELTPEKEMPYVI